MSVDAALHKWAKGSLPIMAAVEIALGTTLREHLVPAFVVTHGDGSAWLDIEAAWADRDSMYLSGSGEVLLTIVANLKGAPGAPVDLVGLYRLDAQNLAVVLSALAIR